MPERFRFNESILHSVASGRSALDLPRLNLQNLNEADAFIKGYGFDLSIDTDLKKLWYYHRRALVLLTEKLGISENEIPEAIRDPKVLSDLRQLLLWASSVHPDEKDLQKWSCAMLRIMHVFVHAENDLFSSFSEEIQKQILTPFQQSIYHEGTTGTTYLRKQDSNIQIGSEEPLALIGFEVKPFKTSSSTVIKLLAKPDALAMSVFDKLGVRFITKSMFDSFRVIRFLIEENLISFPHIMPDQSSNNLYPVELFMEITTQLEKKADQLSDEEIDRFFAEQLSSRIDEFKMLRKENFFSAESHRFIKFISRKLIRISGQEKGSDFTFFYPFEIQIMDQASHQKILTGPAEHQAYKERQRLAAKKRILQ
jgi:uncharacterized protein (TIGR04562 family)